MANGNKISCPACGGVGVVQELAGGGEGLERECFFCQGTGSQATWFQTLADLKFMDAVDPPPPKH